MCNRALNEALDNIKQLEQEQNERLDDKEKGIPHITLMGKEYEDLLAQERVAMLANAEEWKKSRSYKPTPSHFGRRINPMSRKRRWGFQ